MDSFNAWLRALDPRAVDWQQVADRLASEPAAWPLIAGGVALLLFGRRLYWLALGGLGAAVAVTAASYLHLPTAEGQLLVAAIAAIAGALVAIFAQRMVVSAVGFLTGVAAGAWTTPILWPDAGLWLLAIAAVTGLLGLLIAGRLFEALLIIATSASGAWLIVHALIVDALPQLGPRRIPAFIVLVLVGLIAQARKPRKKRRADQDE